jgi:hypothetical protein
MVVGTRAQVWHGTADKTAGGLEKKDLNLKDGRIVSKAQQAAAKANPALAMWREAVQKSGGLKEGTFVPIKGKVLEKAQKKFARLQKKAAK